MVLAMPAGWMVFALLLPVAGVGAKAGWTVATDGLAERRERILGRRLLRISAVESENLFCDERHWRVWGRTPPHTRQQCHSRSLHAPRKSREAGPWAREVRRCGLGDIAFSL